MKQSPSFIPLPKYKLRIVKHYDKNYSFIKETRFVLVVDSLVTTTSDYTFFIDEIYRHKILLIFSPLYFLSRTFSYPQLSNESALRNFCSRRNLSFYISPASGYDSRPDRCFMFRLCGSFSLTADCFVSQNKAILDWGEGISQSATIETIARDKKPSL